MNEKPPLLSKVTGKRNGINVRVVLGPFLCLVLLSFTIVFYSLNMHTDPGTIQAIKRPPSNRIVFAAILSDGRNVHEWIAHHYLMGVSHFILYNHIQNNVNLKPWITLGIVTVLDWPQLSKRQSYMTAYQDALARSQQLRAEYVMMLDLDELLVMTNAMSPTPLVQWLTFLPANTTEVKVQRVEFGTSGHLNRPLFQSKPALMMQSFGERRLVQGTSVSLIAWKEGYQSHAVDVLGQPFTNTSHLIEPMRIHHYHGSFSECLGKQRLELMSRGNMTTPMKYELAETMCNQLNPGSKEYLPMQFTRDVSLLEWIPSVVSLLSALGV
jgi:hypothetical protein